MKIPWNMKVRADRAGETSLGGERGAGVDVWHSKRDLVGAGASVLMEEEILLRALLKSSSSSESSQSSEAVIFADGRLPKTALYKWYSDERQGNAKRLDAQGQLIERRNSPVALWIS
jgi:hypothetical protein